LTTTDGVVNLETDKVPLEPLLRIEDVMEFLRCSRQTVYNLMERGFLQRAEIQGLDSLRFHKSDVVRVIRRRREAVPDANGLRMTEIIEGEGSARNLGESLAELNHEAEIIRQQAAILPPNGEVQDATE
jgi:predicted DNA-binding transcriptional regulator AlpA